MRLGRRSVLIAVNLVAGAERGERGQLQAGHDGVVLHEHKRADRRERGRSAPAGPAPAQGIDLGALGRYDRSVLAVRLGLLCFSVVLASLAGGSRARAQELVYPRRPSQTNVRYADFDWKYIDVHLTKGKTPTLTFPGGSRLHAGVFRPPAAGAAWEWPSLRQAPLTRGGESSSNAATQGAPSAAMPLSGKKASAGTAGAGGVRLYFYENERSIAERAAASIEDSYRYLSSEFGYSPAQTFAYFLYASYIEFLQTDLFPLQEGVLGVTSPESLEVTLPYFGDARMFHDVSTHELAHEFTIQKVRSATHKADVLGSPLDVMPLWFIEGLAEYYAKRGIDDEAEMFVRDILVNPKREHDYVLGSFWEDRLGSGLWTYKVGQVRCAFLEETYGKGTIQRILDKSPLLLQQDEDDELMDFPRLVSKITGASAASVAARFERWVKKRTFRTFLDAKHDRSHFTTMRRTDGIVQSLAASPSGELVLYRSIDPDTGQNHLYLFDRRSPDDDEVVAADGVPGFETLHPVAGRNFDLTDHELSFVAQDAGADAIYLQRLVVSTLPTACENVETRRCGYETDIELGKRTRYAVTERGIAAVEALALSPDGTRIAFVGLHQNGQKDLFVLARGEGDGYQLTQLTFDVYAERSVAWGNDGIVFNSDATGHGKYNLFRIDPAAPGKVVRLTTEARDELDPEVLPDGRVMFVAYDASGANLYEVRGVTVVKQTDVATGLFDVAPGPDGTVWALHHYGADRRPVRISRERFLQVPIVTAPDALPPQAPGVRSLSAARAYDPLLVENWKLGSIFLLAGFSGDSIFGELMATATDRLRDHGLLLRLATFGEAQLTDANLMYVNQEQRVIWGAGLFTDIRSRIDRLFEQSDDLWFVSWERYFGAEALARYPLSRFLFLQGSVSAGGTEYFLLDDTRHALSKPDESFASHNLYAPWLVANDRLRFQTEGGLALGYSSVGLHRATGPIRGNSFLLSLGVGTQPWHDVTYQQLRFDAERYFPITGAVNFFLRGGAGSTFGHERAPQYYLSSFHTLRGVPFGDTDYLLGREFFFTTAELQFPILEFVSFPLIDLEGVLGADFGAVSDTLDTIWRRRLFDLVFGLNLGFGPIVLQLHFGQPIDIGPITPPNDGDLTFNLSLNWRYQ